MKQSQAWRHAGGARVLAALCVLAGMVACASLNERDAHVQPLSRGLTAERVTLVGASGPVNAGVEARDLARVRAEGSGAAF